VAYSQIGSGGTRFHRRNGNDHVESVFQVRGCPHFALLGKVPPEFVSNLLDDAGVTMDELSSNIPHQARRQAIDHAVNLVGFDDGEMVDVFSEFGNHVGSSLPTALHFAVHRRGLQRGERALMLGSGAGLKIGGIVFSTEIRQVFSTRVKFDLLTVGPCRHRGCIALRGGSRRAIDFPALVGLIDHPKQGLMLYDTGYSRHFVDARRGFPECLYRMITPVTRPPAEELLVQLEDRRIRPQEIETVLNSHFHGDQIAGLRDFPRARFIATTKECADCRKSSLLNRLRRAFPHELLPEDLDSRLRYVEDAPLVSLPENWQPFRAGRDIFGDRSLFEIDLPGHTASRLVMAFKNECCGDIFWLATPVGRSKAWLRITSLQLLPML
jgi:glyoxylase-like metal-dependent hydrolase (beta-lactamase superfamily II)